LVGNKVDLLPAGAGPTRLRAWLKRESQVHGLHVAGIALISAHTGEGVAELMRKVKELAHGTSELGHRDIYLVGTTNVGKSTLINTLMKKRYIRSKGMWRGAPEEDRQLRPYQAGNAIESGDKQKTTESKSSANGRDNLIEEFRLEEGDDARDADDADRAHVWRPDGEHDDDTKARLSKRALKDDDELEPLNRKNGDNEEWIHKAELNDGAGPRYNDGMNRKQRRKAALEADPELKERRDRKIIEDMAAPMHAPVTVSPMPGTTLGMVSFPLIPYSFGTIVDTPGVINPHQLSAQLQHDELTAVLPRYITAFPSFMLSILLISHAWRLCCLWYHNNSSRVIPLTYRVEVGQSVLLGGVARLDMIEGRPFFFTICVSKHMSIHIADTRKCDEATFKADWDLRMKRHEEKRLAAEAEATAAAAAEGKTVDNSNKPKEVEVYRGPPLFVSFLDRHIGALMTPPFTRERCQELGVESKPLLSSYSFTHPLLFLILMLIFSFV
jgi:hypothetical protein